MKLEIAGPNSLWVFQMVGVIETELINGVVEKLESWIHCTSRDSFGLRVTVAAVVMLTFSR